MIHYVTAWKTGDIGGGLNAAIALLPDDAWVCVRDGDTLFLETDWGRQIEQIVECNREFALIGCMTNRLRAAYQLHGGAISEEPNISAHIAISRQRRVAYGASVKPQPLGPVAAMLMLFRKSEWAKHRFRERSIYFDSEFCEATRRAGGKVGVAQGLYLFHLYRWGQPDPANSIGHLK